MPELYLASQSPRRRALLAQIGVDFQSLSLELEERAGADETPTDYVQRLARDKAQAGWDQLQARGLEARPVLGADTLGVCANRILEKPENQAHAAEMLRLMSGRSHRVMTAVAVCDQHQLKQCLVSTLVQFRHLTDTEIEAYWHTGEPRDKAGAYAIQGLGGVFVERIEGSYSAVVGLPLAQTTELLAAFGVSWWRAPGRGWRESVREGHE